jgi:cell division protein FtsB
MLDWERLGNFIARHQWLLSGGQWLHATRHKLATAAMSLLIVILAYHVVFSANGMLAYQRKRGDRLKLRQDVLRLQQENERIARTVRELKSDPKAIEREAREQLRYARPGEVVYVAPEPPPPASAAIAHNR